MANLAAIVEEGERQIGDYKTMILPIGDARRLLAVARAAVEMREAQAFYFGRHSIESDADHGSTRLADATAAFDAAVRGEEGGEG